MTLQIQEYMWAVERVRDAFHEAVYTNQDLDAALATTADDVKLLNTPIQSGARGAQGLRRHLAEDVLPHLPADLAFRRMSRTVDKWRVAEETVVSFTHDRKLPWLLPGVAPTHRRAEVLAVSVVTVRRMVIATHRTLWDHYGLLAQLGLDPAELRTSTVTNS